VKRVFNGKPASQPHTRSDYATPVGTPALAVEAGTVVVAKGENGETGDLKWLRLAFPDRRVYIPPSRKPQVLRSCQ
jgi:murein DD-endopeptidase MepM/ murein hydrolase activator NlpD